MASEMIRIAKESDRDALKALWQETFCESQSFLEWLFSERFLPSYCALEELDGCIATAMHALPVQMRIRNAILPCAIVGGVATRPQYRKRGGMHRVFTRLLTELRAYGIPVAVNRPVNLATYATLGQYPVSAAQFVTLQADAPHPTPPVTGRTRAFSLTHGDLSMLYRCYAQFAAQYSVIVCRSYADFSFKCADYSSDHAQCIASFDEHERLDGYCVYFDEGTQLYGDECVACTQSGYDALYAAMAQLARNKALTLRLPPDIALASVPPACSAHVDGTDNCAAPEPLRAQRAIVPHSVMGVADVTGLLAATGLAGGAIEVVDATVSQNAGVYAFDGTATAARPQIVMEAGWLAALVTGYRSLAELADADHAQILDPAVMDTLGALPKLNCFIIDEY